MTFFELRDTLCTDLAELERAATKAKYISQALNNDFFEQFDPARESCKNLIVHEFSRARAYASILDDLIHTIDSVRLSPDWAEALTLDKEG